MHFANKVLIELKNREWNVCITVKGYNLSTINSDTTATPSMFKICKLVWQFVKKVQFLPNKSTMMIIVSLIRSWSPVQNVTICPRACSLTLASLSTQLIYQDSKGPFKYYVSMFLAFFLAHPPAYVGINSTVNQQKMPFSDPTHPPLC